MNKKIKTKSLNTFIQILIFILFIIIIFIIINYYLISILNIKSNLDNNPKKIKKSIEIIISRYKEDLKWTTIEPFNKYKYIVYNKGDDDDYIKSNVKISYNLKNQGKCDHTYLYHLYHNYNNLSDIVVFLPGCLDIYFKYSKAKLLLNCIEKYNEAFFIIDYKSTTSIFHDFFYYQMEEYKSITKTNEVEDGNLKIKKSNIRPFGNWYKKYFDFDIQNITLFGILSFNKKDIYNHEKIYYYNHMKNLEGYINSEVEHYYEKVWEALIFPLNNTLTLNYSNTISNIVIYYLVKYSKYYKNDVGLIYWNAIYFINKYTYYNI